MKAVPPRFKGVWAALRRHGLLLETDASFPSVAALAAGGPVRGSWWGHPKGREIWLATVFLSGHGDVLVTRLVSGKVTHVYRSLWPELLAVAQEESPWQTQGLSPAARALWNRARRSGEVRTDRIPAVKGLGDAARLLEQRLLVHCDEIHTESGAHAKRLETWQDWARRTTYRGKAAEPSKARTRLEELVAAINRRCGATATLPWEKTLSK